MKVATLAILALAITQAPAWAVSDVGEFRSEKTGSSATSDQAEFLGPSSDNEGSTALGRGGKFDELEKTEDEDEVTTYRSTYDRDHYTQRDGSATSTDTSTNTSRAGQTDEGL